jgi:hypothetical protein
MEAGSGWSGCVCGVGVGVCQKGRGGGAHARCPHPHPLRTAVPCGAAPKPLLPHPWCSSGLWAAYGGPPSL